MDVGRECKVRARVQWDAYLLDGVGLEEGGFRIVWGCGMFGS